MPEPLRASVVLCTKDRADLARALVRSLDAQSRRPDEIVIVDGSEANVLEKELADRADIRYVRDAAGSGLAAARNLGARTARNDIVVYLDDDLDLPSDLIERLLRAHADHPEAAAIGGVPFEPSPPSRMRVFFLRTFQRGPFFHAIGVMQADPRSGVIAVERLSTAIMAVKRDLLLRYGFDENLVGPSVGEDADLSVRLARDHPVLLLTDLRARHDGVGWNSRPLASRFERKVYSYAYLYHKDLRGRPGMRARYAWLLVGIAAESVVHAARHRTTQPIRGVWRAAKRLRGDLSGAGGFIDKDPRRL